jgi:hypothetical protein
MLGHEELVVLRVVVGGLGIGLDDAQVPAALRRLPFLNALAFTLGAALS